MSALIPGLTSVFDTMSVPNSMCSGPEAGFRCDNHVGRLQKCVRITDVVEMPMRSENAPMTDLIVSVLEQNGGKVFFHVGDAASLLYSLHV